MSNVCTNINLQARSLIFHASLRINRFRHFVMKTKIRKLNMVITYKYLMSINCNDTIIYLRIFQIHLLKTRWISHYSVVFLINTTLVTICSLTYKKRLSSLVQRVRKICIDLAIHFYLYVKYICIDCTYIFVSWRYFCMYEYVIGLPKQNGTGGSWVWVRHFFKSVIKRTVYRKRLP